MFVGCGAVIPLTSNINDFVMLTLKSNRNDSVSYEIVSYITDGKTIVMNQTGTGRMGTLTIYQGSTLKKMLDEYMYARFSKISDDGVVKIIITLKDFTVQDYNTESKGTQVLKALFAPAYAAVREPRIVSAKITATLNIIRDNTEETKNFIASSEENYIGQFTSENSNRAIATCINSANNKLLMQMNKFFEELGM
jgi:hypothetical protein